MTTANENTVAPETGPATHVATEASSWWERLADQWVPLEEAVRLSSLLKDASRSTSLHLGECRFAFSDSDGKLFIERKNRLDSSDRGERFELNHWSFGQVCSLLGAPAKYVRSRPGPLAVENLNHDLVKRSKDVTVFRTVREVGGLRPNTVRAVTSSRYGRFFDLDLLQWVREAHYPTSKVAISDRGVSVTLHGKTLAAPDIGHLLLNLLTENSEVGASSVSANVVIERSGLRIPLTIGKVRVRHLGDEKKVKEKSREKLNLSREEFEKVDRSDLERRLWDAAGWETRTRGEWYAFLKSKGVGRSTADRILPRPSRDDDIKTSRWELAIRLAHRAYDIPYFDTRLAAELLASKVLGI